MPVGLLGRKIGMTQIYGGDGVIIPVTVIEAGPCTVLQIRTPQRDGYEAVQIGFDDKPRKRARRSERGHVAAINSNRRRKRVEGGVQLTVKAGCEPKRFIREFRTDGGSHGCDVGQELSVDNLLVDLLARKGGSARLSHIQMPASESAASSSAEGTGAGGSDAESQEADGPQIVTNTGGAIEFVDPAKKKVYERHVIHAGAQLLVKDGQSVRPGQPICRVVPHIDVIGTSKGRGTAGVMKRHNFSGQRASHGVKRVHRHGGSIGMSADPSRVLKGTRMPGRYGSSRVTVRHLRVVRIDREKNLLVVEGAIPGPNGGYVVIRQSNKFD